MRRKHVSEGRLDMRSRTRALVALGVVLLCTGAVEPEQDDLQTAWLQLVGCVGEGARPLAAYNAAGGALALMDARGVRVPEAYADALAAKREAENALLGGMVRVTAQVSRVNSELLRQGLVTDGQPLPCPDAGEVSP